MELQHGYLAEYIAAPDQLTGLKEHIAHEVAARRRSAFSHVQMRTLLLSGSSVSAAYGHFANQAYPDFPDASKVERTQDAIEQYLGRLIAPDAVAGVRDVLCDYLAIAELDETASLLARLVELAPEAATALLELRIGRGNRLLMGRIQLANLNQQDSSELQELEACVTNVARVRIAYLLRSTAMACAAQIHAPLNFTALDGLEQPKAAGNLRLHTLMKRIRADIVLAEKAFEIYTRNHRRPIPHRLHYNPILGEKSIKLSFAEVDLSSPAADVATFRVHGLEDRARVQLALWRAAHGDHFDALLEHTITGLRKELADLKHRLGAVAQSAGGNTIVGNLGRTKAGVKLHFAVEEAVAWTAEPNDLPDDWEARLRGAPVVSPITAALASIHPRRKNARNVPIPARAHEHAFFVAHVFMALRFAFLQDNEVLPLTLREVRDPTTNKKTVVKTHDRAARLQGRHYDFSEQWDAFDQKRLSKAGDLPDDASSIQHSQANHIDYDIKRGAHAMRDMARGRPLRDAFSPMLDLRSAIVRGFLVE